MGEKRTWSSLPDELRHMALSYVKNERLYDHHLVSKEWTSDFFASRKVLEPKNVRNFDALKFWTLNCPNLTHVTCPAWVSDAHFIFLCKNVQVSQIFNCF